MKAILMLNEMPISCKDCKFRMNKTRVHWHCGITKGYAEQPIGFGALTDVETKRADHCPLIEINDNIARLIEVAR